MFEAPLSSTTTNPISVKLMELKGINDAVWNFGDGCEEKGISADHLYAAPGKYNITVLIDFFGGIKLTGSQEISIADGKFVGENEIINGINYG